MIVDSYSSRGDELENKSADKPYREATQGASQGLLGGVQVLSYLNKPSQEVDYHRKGKVSADGPIIPSCGNAYGEQQGKQTRRAVNLRNQNLLLARV